MTMREAFCITCNRITAHNRKGCDVCKRTIEMDIKKVEIKEYLIPPTESVREDTNKGSVIQSMDGGFLYRPAEKKAMPTSTEANGIDLTRLSKSQIVNLVNTGLTPSAKLKLFSQAQQTPTPESLEKQDYVDLKRTSKGATIKSFITRNNYAYLTGHQMMSYLKPSNKDENGVVKESKGFMFVKDEHLSEFIRAFQSIGAQVNWLVKIPANADEIPQVAE